MVNIFLTGRLTADPTITENNGRTCCNFSVAAKTRRKGDDGEYISAPWSPYPAALINPLIFPIMANREAVCKSTLLTSSFFLRERSSKIRALMRRICSLEHNELR